MNGDGPRYFGKYRASVINNLDPQSKGRVQVQLADRYGLFPSTWAEPCLLAAGRGSAGILALPAVGGMVWVEFEAGDPDYPIWSGAFYDSSPGHSTQAIMGATPVTPNIHLQTTTGTTVTLSDNPSAQVSIKTVAGAMITIGVSGITLTNGQGASIQMSGPSVIINNGALTIT